MSFKKEVVHYSLLNNYCHARTITASKNPTQATPTLFGTKSVSLPETHIVWTSSVYKIFLRSPFTTQQIRINTGLRTFVFSRKKTSCHLWEYLLPELTTWSEQILAKRIVSIVNKSLCESGGFSETLFFGVLRNLGTLLYLRTSSRSTTSAACGQKQIGTSPVTIPRMARSGHSSAGRTLHGVASSTRPVAR